MTEPPPQPPYGSYPPQPPQPPYGGVPYGGNVPPDHAQATTVLVLGIVGLVACQLAAPFAWVMGNRVVAEIDASGGQLGGRSSANAGRICGIIGTVLLGLWILTLIGVVALAIVGVATTS